jgi:hypothetical protein
LSSAQREEESVMPEKRSTAKKTAKKRSNKVGRSEMLLMPHGQARHEALDDAIHRLYHSMKAEDFELEEDSFMHSHMEMYSIECFQENGVELKDFTNDELVSPVIFPMEVLEYLRPGDLFLFSLGYAERRWYVIWMSGLYQ